MIHACNLKTGELYKWYNIILLYLGKEPMFHGQSMYKFLYETEVITYVWDDLLLVGMNEL